MRTDDEECLAPIRRALMRPSRRSVVHNLEELILKKCAMGMFGIDFGSDERIWDEIPPKLVPVWITTVCTGKSATCLSRLVLSLSTKWKITFLSGFPNAFRLCTISREVVHQDYLSEEFLRTVVDHRMNCSQESWPCLIVKDDNYRHPRQISWVRNFSAPEIIKLPLLTDLMKWIDRIALQWIPDIHQLSIVRHFVTGKKIKLKLSPASLWRSRVRTNNLMYSGQDCFKMFQYLAWARLYIGKFWSNLWSNKYHITYS